MQEKKMKCKIAGRILTARGMGRYIYDVPEGGGGVKTYCYNTISIVLGGGGSKTGNFWGTSNLWSRYNKRENKRKISENLISGWG